MLKKTVLARAFAIAFGVAVAGMTSMQIATAQSNATGNVAGKVDQPAGSSIVVVNAETGLRRTATPDANGRYQVTALPPGNYRVELLREGTVIDSTVTEVLIGQGTTASFSGAVQKVQVSGRRTRIDVSSTTNGAVFTAKELGKLPVATNLTSIVLLAPNTTSADAAFGGASFGGAGASENSFYLNGFPITNPLTQLGSMELPFGAIGQASVLTGGFGAEFGRSIGGVVSVTSKSGTNSWEGGATASVTPNSSRASSRNIYYPDTGVHPDTDGKLHFRRDNNYNQVTQLGAFFGGPLIKDKLFLFVAGDVTTNERRFTDNAGGTAASVTTIERNGWNVRENDNRRYLAKLDWRVTDNHNVELTAAGDNNVDRQRTYNYTLDGGETDGKALALADMRGTPGNMKWSDLETKNPGSTGASVLALKYTGNITDDLTLTTMFGHLTAERGVTYEGGANPPASIANATAAVRVPSIDPNLYTNYNKYPGNLTLPGEDKVKSFRLDLEYKLGNHKIRAGLDNNELEALNAGVVRSGGSTWTYRRTAAANPCAPASLAGGRNAVVCDFGGFGTDGYYARQRKFLTITDATSKQSAQYIEDQWQATPNLLLTGGLRNEAYSNNNGDGEKFVDMKRQIAPRLAASWNVFGDASLKVFGSAGRYYLQLPTQVAARAASRSTLTDQDFTYSGIDPTTGAPTGLVAINTAISPDGEYGTRKDPRSVVARHLKPNYQDEITAGFERALTPNFNGGVKATYRRLGAGIDDNCDTRRLFVRAQQLGIPVVQKDFMNCFIFNPGEDVTLYLDGHDAMGQPIVSGKGQYTTFSAAELGYPKAKRSYKSIDAFLEHPMRNGWYGKASYTWSKNEGNMEGQTRSDTGQADVGTSAAWDFPEFQVGSYGLLPNDRRHQLKGFGYYEWSPQLSFGANALLQSGRPKTCLGTNLAAENGDQDPYGYLGGPGYGAEYYHCAGRPVARGTIGRMPWERRLDVNVTYRPLALKGLALRMDVFNLANSQRTLARQETYDDGSTNDVLETYNEARTLQASRTMKFSIDYTHRF